MKKAGKVYFFDPDGQQLEQGLVVVDTVNGAAFGELVMTEREVPDEQVVLPLRKVLRQATQEDIDRREAQIKKQEEAMKICEEKIAAHQLDMKLVNVELAFDNSKLTFYFTADGRVDFRELVKELAHVFRTRIELRQIGVRDETKMLGGIGACGRPCCCALYMNEFAPVSIKMAKEQNLSLNPTKISGICGRLMCCLKYEEDYYEEVHKEMPKVGKEIKTPDGNGILLENNVLKKTCRVRVSLPDGTVDIRSYPLEDIKRAEQGLPPLKKQDPFESFAPLRSETVSGTQSQQERSSRSQNAKKKRPQQGQGQSKPGQKSGQEKQGGKDRPGDPNRKKQSAGSPKKGSGQPKSGQEKETVRLRPAQEKPKSSGGHRNSRRRRPQHSPKSGAQETVRLVPASGKRNDDSK